jgi:hypothetical protein
LRFVQVILFLGFSCCAFLLSAQQSETLPKFVGPMLWSTPVEAFATSGGEPAFLASMFTPDTEILVTRIDAFDANGPRLNRNSVTGQMEPCLPQPAIRIENASNGFTLQLTNTFLPNSSATYTDSGPLSLKFDKGVPIRLAVVPPTPKQAAQCLTRQLNVQVHYMVTLRAQK